MKTPPILVGMFALAAILAPNFANATCATYVCWNEQIEMLYPNKSGPVYVTTTGNEGNLTQCTPLSGKYFVMNMSDLGASAIYSTLLAAFHADEDIRIVAVPGSNPCQISYVTVSN